MKKNGLGAIEFFCMGFGAIVGCGWALSINKWMVNAGGPLSSGIGYLLCLFVMIPIGLCYSELSPMFPVAGGAMAYAHRAFSERLSYLVGWLALGGYVIIIPWEAIYVVDVLSNLFPCLTAGEPLYELAGNGVYLSHIIIGVAISLLFFVINMCGVKSSSKMQNILCFVLLGSGILTMIMALTTFNASNFLPIYESPPSGTHSTFGGGIFSVISTAAFFLCGFETIPQAVEDAEKSKKNIIGKTVVLSITSACLFYAFLVFTIGGAMPWKEFSVLGSPAAAQLFLVTQKGMIGKFMYTLVLVGAICGMLTTWNGFMLATSKIMMSMSRGKLLPSCFSKTHPKTGAPTMGLAVCLIISCLGVCLGMGLIDPMTNMSSTSLVATWMVTSLCFLKLRKCEPMLERPYKVPCGILIGGIAFIATAISFIGFFIPSMPMYTSVTSIIMFLSWLMIGVIIWFAMSGVRKKTTLEERVASLFIKR